MITFLPETQNKVEIMEEQWTEAQIKFEATNKKLVLAKYYKQEHNSKSFYCHSFFLFVYFLVELNYNLLREMNHLEVELSF